MKDLGEAKTGLKLEITRDRSHRQLSLSQTKYIDSILERFNMKNCRPVSTPMEESHRLEDKLEMHSEDGECSIGGEVPYREAIGRLMYLMIRALPDLSYPVSKLSQFCEYPGKKHWDAVKRVIRNLKGTRRIGIKFDGLCNFDVHGYSDSDWAEDVSDRKPTGAYIFFAAGGPVSSCSKKQTVVATSTCEAEYIALCAVCKAVWLQRIVREFPLCDRHEMIVYSDSTVRLSCLKMKRSIVGINTSISRITMFGT